MGCVANYPLSGTPISGSSDQKRTNFQILESWWNVEHFTFTSAGSGDHTAGRVATLYYGTQAQINALSSPGSGGLAWATDKGTLELYRGSWQRLTENAFSRVRNVASSADIPTNTLTPVVTWESTSASGMYDTLDEWANSKFTAKAAGYYAITFSASFVFSNTYCRKIIGVYKNGTLCIQASRFDKGGGHCYNFDVVPLNAGDYIEMKVWHNLGSSYILYAGNIHIQRIS